jgi:hypothetical protein
VSGGNALNQVGDGLQLASAKLHRGKHIVFRKLFCPCFHHENFFGSTGDHQVKVSRLGLLIGWHQYVLAVYATDTNRGNRSTPRNVAHGERAGGSDKAGNIGVIFLIVRKDGCDNGYFVTKRVRKKRAYRTIDKTTRKNRLICWATFAFNKTRAFDASCRVHTLFKIHGKGEEARVITRFAHACCAQNNGIAVAYNTRGIGLLSELSDADGKLASRKGKGIDSRLSNHINRLRECCGEKRGMARSVEGLWLARSEVGQSVRQEARPLLRKEG